MKLSVNDRLEPLWAVVLAHFPELEGSPVELLAAGWDSLALGVDDRLIFKFPRDEADAHALVTEARLLSVVRPAVTIAVPELIIHEGPPLFSRHAKLAGEHLLAAHYEQLPLAARQRLAAEMAQFYAELHRLDRAVLTAAGAKAIAPWLPPEDILQRAWPRLSPSLQRFAETTIADWQALPPDPHGTTYGFFDGHGWNMAFDHEHQRLNGIYDFGDSGFGSLQQEFIYTSFIARDLTMRVVDEYEALTGLVLDRRRIDALTGVLRVVDLAELPEDDERLPQMQRFVADWATALQDAG